MVSRKNLLTIGLLVFIFLLTLCTGCQQSSYIPSCELLEGDQRDVCYLTSSRGTQNEDISICDLVSSGNRDSCLVTKADKWKNQETCFKILNQNTLARCISTVARSRKEPALCEKIKVAKYASECYQEFGMSPQQINETGNAIKPEPSEHKSDSPPPQKLSFEDRQFLNATFSANNCGRWPFIDDSCQNFLCRCIYLGFQKGNMSECSPLFKIKQECKSKPMDLDRVFSLLYKGHGQTFTDLTNAMEKDRQRRLGYLSPAQTETLSSIEQQYCEKDSLCEDELCECARDGLKTIKSCDRLKEAVNVLNWCSSEEAYRLLEIISFIEYQETPLQSEVANASSKEQVPIDVTSHSDAKSEKNTTPQENPMGIKAIANWTIAAGDWTVDNEKVTSSPGADNNLIINNKPCIQCEVRVSARNNAGSGFRFGIVFNYKSPIDFSEFVISDEYNKAQITVVKGDKYGTDIKLVDRPIETGKDYSLNLRVINGTIGAYLDGDELFIIRDDRESEAVGLITHLGDFEFSSFNIS